MAAERTRRKAKFGRFMQALRKQAPEKLRPEDVAPKVRVVTTTITRMEGGYSLPNFTLMQALLGIYGVSDEERADAEQLWEHAKQGATTVENAADLPPKYRAFRRDEADAITARTLAPVAVPGPLQTAGYAEATAEAARRHIHAEGWERRAADERRNRQRLLEGPNALKLHAIIDEAVLRRVVGGPEVMAEQLQHLLSAAARRNITIQVVPFSVGAYGTMSGQVTILGFEDEADPDLAYLDYPAGGETVENQRDVQAFADTFEHVSRKVALSPKESVKLIRAALDGLRNDDRKQDLA
ncbi:helix-turn-helix domain-containing protein [Amycolatopsis anabasis]|uniref:helix-turn-helix domain-containing protein n=1 Tax=Amycolatopsis anabasis TaxID=1840409 RepID=UPI00131C0743|nr:helix-turn-helix transcriptional regulator [Amycolatopsis anabasis]